ncbi:hypothetical protein [Halalkalibacter akibai]|uniref:Uncharacterized protein n=1 Tax=Halalkalibacter akibai (strain ATCC 43226 / DSM 21942 / CIP 109018 / JCM 9157 / 1139) TaxID=1236973 RepID=W4QQN7_HALA3|nr:hypothetical protein [Halalkalibacter akibai]GAE33664.1 hypothetical protein JCM9157_684 [Halalkalibacter akibai JCM 9157]
MKDFFIRAISGFIILFLLLYIAPMLQMEWVQPGSPYRFMIVPLALVGGWACLFFFKRFEKKKTW